MICPQKFRWGVKKLFVILGQIECLVLAGTKGRNHLEKLKRSISKCLKQVPLSFWNGAFVKSAAAI